MTLLDLRPNGTSLEFSLEEWPAIRSALRALGPVRRRQQATFDYLTVAGAKLILMNDWDDPCLIASDASGQKIVRWIADAPSLATLPQAA